MLVARPLTPDRLNLHLFRYWTMFPKQNDTFGRETSSDLNCKTTIIRYTISDNNEDGIEDKMMCTIVDIQVEHSTKTIYKYYWSVTTSTYKSIFIISFKKYCALCLPMVYGITVTLVFIPKRTCHHNRRELDQVHRNVSETFQSKMPSLA